MNKQGVTLSEQRWEELVEFAKESIYITLMMVQVFLMKKLWLLFLY